MSLPWRRVVADIMFLLMVLVLILLSGCALQPPQPPEQRTTTVQVKVPVPTFVNEPPPLSKPE